MMSSTPQTLQDWVTYTKDLDRKEVGSQCKAANSMQFVRRLLAEGQDMTFIEEVLRLFVRRMTMLEVRLPMGGAFDLDDIRSRDRVAP